MRTYLLDIIPKIQKYSQKLDNLTVLLNKNWVILDETSDEKLVFIFREKDNQLLISNNGKIEKGTWDYLGNNSLLIDRDSGSFLFKHGFIDECVLALKVDGTSEYALLVNEEWFEKQIKSIKSLISFLNDKYIDQKMNNTISIPATKYGSLEERNLPDASVNNFTVKWEEISIPDKMKKEVGSDIQFLKFSLKEIDYYIKYFKSNLFPFYAALKLDSFKIVIDHQSKQNLEKIAKKEFGMNSINAVLLTIANSGSSQIPGIPEKV